MYFDVVLKKNRIGLYYKFKNRFLTLEFNFKKNKRKDF